MEGEELLHVAPLRFKISLPLFTMTAVITFSQFVRALCSLESLWYISRVIVLGKCSDQAILWLLKFPNLFGIEYSNHDLSLQSQTLPLPCPLLQPNWIPSVSYKDPWSPPYSHARCALSFISTWANPTCLSRLRSNVFPDSFPVNNNLYFLDFIWLRIPYGISPKW